MSVLCCAYLFSCVWLFVIQWAVACQAPLSMGILQARIFELVVMPSPGDFPNSRIKPRSPTLQVDSLTSVPPGKPQNTEVGSLSLLRVSSQPRNQTEVSWIAGSCYISWNTRETPLNVYFSSNPHFTNVCEYNSFLHKQISFFLSRLVFSAKRVALFLLELGNNRLFKIIILCLLQVSCGLFFFVFIPLYCLKEQPL